MISVIIPLYNKEQLIAKTLRSVLAQSYTDYEVIVVDDGSTDGSAAAVRALGDPRITLLSQPNAGVSAARNCGIRAARGEWIALLDADDLWLPDYLATQVALAEKYPEAQVCATDYLFRDEHGLTTPTRINRLPFTGPDGILSNYFEVASCSHPPICSISIMARRSALLAVGAFPEGVKSGEDLITWAKLAVKYQIAYSKTVGAIFVGLPSNSGVSKPKERFSRHDYVLESLVQLENEADNAILKRDLHSYILRWYKIQCVIMLEIGYGRGCISYALRALRKGGKAKYFIPLMILGMMPQSICTRLLKKRRK